MTDAFENSFATHEARNETNTESHVAQSVKEILQHAHRHVSDAIDCDENNYGESAVRSYSLAMDYFKTYLKMNAIGISGGKFGAFRAVARWNSSDGKKTCTKKRSEDVVFLSFTSSSLCVFRTVSSSLCVCFIRRRRRIKMVVCETFTREDADGRTFLGFRDKVVVFRFFLSSVFFQCFRLSFSFSFSHF